MSTASLRVAAFLSSPMSPAVLRSADLRRLAGGADAARITADLVEEGFLRRLLRGLYLNTARACEKAAILPHVAPHGVLSLAYVLGEEGVLNNPTGNLTLVAPLIRGFSRDSRRLLDGTQLLIHHLPERLFGFGVEAGRGYNRAQPERALADWLYLAASPRSRMIPPPDDVDLDRLRLDRLRRYTRRMGLADSRIDSWLDCVGQSEPSGSPH